MMIVDERSCEPAVSTRSKLQQQDNQIRGEMKRMRNLEFGEIGWIHNEGVRLRWGLPNGFAIADGQSLHLWVKANSELLRFRESQTPFLTEHKHHTKVPSPLKKTLRGTLGKVKTKSRSKSMKIDENVLETGEVRPHIQFLSIEKGRQDGLGAWVQAKNRTSKPHQSRMSKVKKSCQNATWDIHLCRTGIVNHLCLKIQEIDKDGVSVSLRTRCDFCCDILRTCWAKKIPSSEALRKEICEIRNWKNWKKNVLIRKFLS